MILKSTEKKRNRGSKRAQAGVSLVEMVAATLILAMVALVLAAGIPAVNQTYRKMVMENESLTLASYVTRLVSDEFRHAKNITTAAGALDTYKSARYKTGARLGTQDGLLIVEADAPGVPGATIKYELLNRGAYTKGLAVELSTIYYNSGTGVFSLNVVVYDKAAKAGGASTADAAVRTIPLKIRNLNP